MSIGDLVHHLQSPLKAEQHSIAEEGEKKKEKRKRIGLGVTESDRVYQKLGFPSVS